MFQKVLIANRGEIAVRILRACHELGISVVAVYSDADRSALHVRLADEAIHIGPSNAAESYLNHQKIIQAAQQAGAEAIHPGYGFLSENEKFAAGVRVAGLTFIGPPEQAIQIMGDKAAARALMQQAGVPIVPGYQGVDDLASLHAAAQEIGFPILVKAAAGGGGKGMRIVHEPDSFEEAAAAARREALHAFGDERLILERFIPDAHHIEIQVLADQHGQIVHLFERECSVQRRHQKIIEETPSPQLDEPLRQEMGRAAIAAARTAGYQNAGTVEFIFNPASRSFYFLEMNTRLQVEHPITELVAGLDLVQWQLRIASGERLPFTQEQLSQRGHAMECRLYAEDPTNNFLPSTGSLLQLIPPHGPGIRFDSGFERGDTIGLHYDPLIAKTITYAADRLACIQKMEQALRSTVVLGVENNIAFLQEVLTHPDFLAGKVHTNWVEKTYSGWQQPDCGIPTEALIAAALTRPNRETSGKPAETDPHSPWREAHSFRLGS